MSLKYLSPITYQELYDDDLKWKNYYLTSSWKMRSFRTTKYRWKPYRTREVFIKCGIEPQGKLFSN